MADGDLESGRGREDEWQAWALQRKPDTHAIGDNDQQGARTGCVGDLHFFPTSAEGAVGTFTPTLGQWS